MKSILLQNRSQINILVKAFLLSGIFLMFNNDAFASDLTYSLTYSIASRMIDATEYFTMSLFSSISEAYRPLYLKIASIGLIIILLKFMVTNVPPVQEMLSFTIAMMLSSTLAFDPEFFHEIVYNTFFDTLYRLDQFVVQSSASNLPKSSNINFDSLEGVFRTVDAGLMGISDFASKVARETTGWSNIPLLLESWIIYLLYLFICTYFLVVFTISIFGAHMMIILMPITISLYPFKKFRSYSTNCISGMFHYGLVTVFACVSISLVVFISNDLVVEANQLKEAAAISGEPLEIPSGFLTASIMVGFLAIFFIKISTEFASRVLNSATSQVGGMFPMMIAGAATLAKGSAGAAKIAAPAAVVGGAYGARGAASALKQFQGRGSASSPSKFSKSMSN